MQAVFSRYHAENETKSDNGALDYILKLGNARLELTYIEFQACAVFRVYPITNLIAIANLSPGAITLVLLMLVVTNVVLSKVANFSK